MQIINTRRFAAQIAFAVAGLVIAAGLVWTLAKILQPFAPAPGPSITAEQLAQLNQARVEHRKDAIAQYLAAKYRKHVEVVRSYVDLAWKETAKHRDVPPEMALAVMLKESSLRADAKSDYGAQGLMQVVRRWHKEKLNKHESLLDPRVNVRVGTQILQQYIDEKGQIELALVKYSGDANGYADFVLRETKVLQAI
jgi:soluble lytic murein transglycosylase-like protein